MAKSIFVTGIAGTGKSSVCAELEKRGYKAFDIENIEGLFAMYDRRTGKPYKNYDDHDIEKVKNHDWICDEKKLRGLMRKNAEEVTFYCGIASNGFELMKLFDKVMLLCADSNVIRKRLSERTNNDFGKTREVQDMVLGEKDTWEKSMKEEGAIVIDSNCSLGEMAEKIINKI